MGKNVKIGGLAEAVMSQLEAYAKATREDVKSAVKSSAGTVKKEIKNNAPKRTGTYRGSWKATRTAETADALTMTVHSPKRYMIAHLLENGHAKRNGGRVPGIPHIGPAEEKGVEQLMQELEEKLKG
ncbi:MAG: HK97 gp10 family phage protein [Selenomonadaceae bacterium]|nr:HK97 gp10 family phage protein [Selenomonadaceae bacterium]